MELVILGLGFLIGLNPKEVTPSSTRMVDARHMLGGYSLSHLANERDLSAIMQARTLTPSGCNKGE